MKGGGRWGPARCRGVRRSEPQRRSRWLLSLPTPSARHPVGRWWSRAGASRLDAWSALAALAATRCPPCSARPGGSLHIRLGRPAAAGSAPAGWTSGRRAGPAGRPTFPGSAFRGPVGPGPIPFPIAGRAPARRTAPAPGGGRSALAWSRRSGPARRCSGRPRSGSLSRR